MQHVRKVAQAPAGKFARQLIALLEGHDEYAHHGVQGEYDHAEEEGQQVVHGLDDIGDLLAQILTAKIAHQPQAYAQRQQHATHPQHQDAVKHHRITGGLHG